MSRSDLPSSTLGDVLSERRRRRFVGRTAEIELFRSALDDDVDQPFSVLFVHGPGGIGKTSLLEVFAEIAGAAGATVVRIDAHDLDPSPIGVLDALAPTLVVPNGDEPIVVADGGGRLVLLVDAHEHLGPLGEWLHRHLLRRLPATSVAVVAGRTPPTADWRADPSWGPLLRVVSLRNLDPDDTRTALAEAGVAANRQDAIARLTYGHPLALALLTDVVVRGGDVDPHALPLDVVNVLVTRFIDTVPGNWYRRALLACGIARCTTKSLLRDVLHDDDVDEVFQWLADLSFVEARADGLAPHDMARDVLDADLRWRDPDGYRRVFHRVREHCLAALRTSGDRAQQRAIADLKYLFRQVRTAMSPVEWGSWGAFYPEATRPDDYPVLMKLVHDWEGDRSAEIAARWLGRQPKGFFVVRDADRHIRGMLATLDLSRATQHEIDADPGARAAWEHAHRVAPPRPAEAVMMCRFVIDRDAYQGPSPTLSATPILTLQRQLETPRLAWDFLALAEPDRWNDYFAAADLPRAAGADFVVGHRRYGLFAHDFRRVPVDVMTERWTDRALAQGVGALDSAHQVENVVLSYADFESAVRRALKDIKRPDRLARNPLMRTGLIADQAGEQPPSVADLVAVLHSAASTLAQDPRDDKLLRAIDRTYLRPAASQEAAAEALGLPFSTYRRHLAHGITRIVAILWDREIYGHK